MAFSQVLVIILSATLAAGQQEETSLTQANCVELCRLYVENGLPSEQLDISDTFEESLISDDEDGQCEAYCTCVRNDPPVDPYYYLASWCGVATY